MRPMNMVACAVTTLMAVYFTAAPAQENKPVEQQAKAEGYQGIWYYNQKLKNEYVYKYSGGLGTYPSNHIPFSIYSKDANKTFFVYGGHGIVNGKPTLLEMVSHYDHTTGTVPRPTILMDKKTDDAHDNPVISLDEQGHVWVFASSHGTARPSYIFKSRKPYDTDAFDLVLETNFSYPEPWYFKGKGFLFLHTRYQKGRCLYSMTSADGINWSEGRMLAKIAQGHYQVSWPCGEKVGTAFNYHPAKGGLNWRTNLYYIQSDDFAKTWKNVQGEAVDVPLTEIKNKALVHDYEAEKLLVYIQDINYDAAGNPIILYITSKGFESGPENGPRVWTTARWTGVEWDIRGTIASDNNYDTGGLHIEPDGTWRIIGPTETGPQPYNPGGEIAVWTSTDQGKTWTKLRQVTKDSPFNHTYARRPVNAHPDFYAYWADGHGRQPSESRLYFCNQTGEKVFRLPYTMKADQEKPEQVK
ncbi:MAG: BNR-4 repeat-containing protein [Planctomycetota bacterium]